MPVAPQVLDGRTLGALLKRWREHRRLSQLELGLRADTSQRHLSYIETGRANPSRVMLMRIADALDVPPRERDRLMLSAGFSPAPNPELTDPQLGGLRHVLQRLLEAHHAFPAFVVDRYWDLLLANRSAQRLRSMLVPDGSAAIGDRPNLLRLMAHPAGLRCSVANWPDAMAAFLYRIEHERLASLPDPRLEELAKEVATYPDVAQLRRRPLFTGDGDVLVPLVLRVEGTTISLITMSTRLTSATTAFLEELRLESLLPSDSASERALHQLLDTAAEA